MHRVAVSAVIALTSVLAGCGGGGANDSGTVHLPASLPASPTGGARVGPDTAAGPATKAVALQGSRATRSWLVEFPALPTTTASGRTVDASVRRREQALVDAWLARPAGGAGRSLSCTSDVLLDTVTLLSFRTTCTAGPASAGVLTATYAQAGGDLLTLGDVLTGDYLPVLAADARTQLTLGGASATVAARAAVPTAAAFSDWALDPTQLEVTFAITPHPVTVDFAYAPLAPYVARRGLLARG